MLFMLHYWLIFLISHTVAFVFICPLGKFNFMPQGTLLNSFSFSQRGECVLCVKGLTLQSIILVHVLIKTNSTLVCAKDAIKAFL